MSTPDKSTAPKNRGWLLTAGGTLLVLAIAGTVNIIAGLSSSRLDWTEYKVHTLTDGTRNIVGKVDTDTTLKFFVSPKDQLPPNLRPLVDQTDSWLARYRELNPKFVRIEKQEVEPATDEEEAAKAAGIEPRGGRFYFGIAVNSLDKSALIDWVPDLLSSDGKEDDKIEYNLSRAISEVNRTKAKTLGLLTPLPVQGNPFGGSQPWAIYQALKSQYDIKTIEATAATIDPALDVLVLIHPAGISEETQFAVDQYLLNGGRVVAFLDSSSLAATTTGRPQPGMPPGMSPGAVEPASNLPKLLGAWGYSLDTTNIVADPAYGMNMQGTSFPVVMEIGPDAVGDKNDDVIKSLTNFFFIYSGAFSGSPASGLTETVLLKTTDKHSMVPISYANANPGSPESLRQMQELAYKLKPEGKQRLLALRLKGNFKTAFPEGKPAPAPKPEGGAAPGGFPGGLPGGLPGIIPGGPQGAQGDTGTAAPATPAAAPATAATPAPENPPAAATPAAPAPAATAVTPAIEIKPDKPEVTNPATPPGKEPTASATLEVPTTPAIPSAAPAPAPLPVTPNPATPETPAAPATPATPPAEAQLKESKKEGVVYLVADSDILFDQVGPVFNSHDFALAMNMIDQAAGDPDLMQVRGRGSAIRPFSALKKIADDANAKIQKDVEQMQGELAKIQEDINSKKTGKERNAALYKGMVELQQKQRDLNKNIYQKQKEARKEYDQVIFGIKWRNLLIPPLLWLIAGLAVFLVRKTRTAAH
ncbi:MAG: Gldg family protein [Verrucomicrobiota bacterium]